MANQLSSIEELERLQNRVTALENLLKSFQQSQLQQTQALAAFLLSNGEKGIEDLNQPNSQLHYQIPWKSPPPPITIHIPKVSLRHDSVSVPNAGDGYQQSFDEDVRNWSEIYGIDEDSMRLELKRYGEIFINTRIPDLGKASAELRNAGINFFWCMDQENHHDDDDDLRLPEFLALTGEANQPISVGIRDFTDMGCGNVLYYTASNFEDLWTALSRPRKMGMQTNMLQDEESQKWAKIRAYIGINEDGGGAHPAYGREIVIGRLTPNIATAILITAAYKSLKLGSIEPAESLSRAVSLALQREPRSMQNYEGYVNHDTFMFTAVFFELVDSDDAGIAAFSNKFGSKWEGTFAPRNSTKADKLRKIRQTTLSLVFDSVGAESGTYWTITSIGKYSDEKAFEKPRNVKAEDVAAAGYTAPEEVFLDKLARVIDWAVDDGMMEVLDQLERELEIPATTLFSQEDNEKLLFDDHQFSRSKRYHWALQWLRKMFDSMNQLVTAIEEFEKTSLPNLRRNAQAHRIRSGVKKGKIQSDLSIEKVFERKVERAKQLRTKIEAKYTEIKDFRDALVSASGVLESRAAVSQAESMHILTVFMIIFLPVTIVISTFSMEFLPIAYKTLNTFGTTMGVVFVVTLILGLNLGSFLMLGSKYAHRFGKSLQASMIQLGHSWEEKGGALKETDEADNLVRRGKRVPAELWYTWYCILWVMFILPTDELYRVGGLRGLVGRMRRTTMKSGAQAGQYEGAWFMAIIPLRVLLLPLHVITIVFDYFLLLIFSKTLLGWDCKSPKEPWPHKGKNPTLEERSSSKEDSSASWKDRFWAPVAILQELPRRSYRQTPNSTELNTQSSNRPVLSRYRKYSSSTMDILRQGTVRYSREVGPTNTNGVEKSSMQLALEMESSHTLVDQPSGAHSMQPEKVLPSAPYPEDFDIQNPTYVAVVPPEPATKYVFPRGPFISRAESAPVNHTGGWGRSWGIIGRPGSNARGLQIDPERASAGNGHTIGR